MSKSRDAVFRSQAADHVYVSIPGGHEGSFVGSYTPAGPEPQNSVTAVTSGFNRPSLHSLSLGKRQAW